MNIFKKFKVKFDLRKKVQSGKEKVDTAEEIRCLKYRIFSEFSEEQDFNINSSTSKENSFKRVELKKLNTRSVSENDLRNNKQYQETNTDSTKNVATKNHLWPSASALDLSHQITEDFSHNSIHHNETIEQKVAEALPKNIKSILKNTNSKTKSDYEDSQPSYEPYERIDLDIQNEEEIYYFDQPQDEFEEDYVVHQMNKEEVSEHYYEEPIGRYDGFMTIQTHSKLNDKKSENMGVEFNSFGNTQKLRNPAMYSNEAMDIFFANDVTKDNDHPASQIIFSDNLSEMSA